MTALIQIHIWDLLSVPVLSSQGKDWMAHLELGVTSVLYCSSNIFPQFNDLRPCKCIILSSLAGSSAWVSLGWKQGVSRAAFLSQGSRKKSISLTFVASRHYPHVLAYGSFLLSLKPAGLYLTVLPLDPSDSHVQALCITPHSLLLLVLFIFWANVKDLTLN